jgi:hypothetical protein
MNFDHWKDVAEPDFEPATPPANLVASRMAGRRSEIREPKSGSSISSEHACTRMPCGSSKGPANLAACDSPEEFRPGTVHHFVASDPAPDMDLAFSDIDRRFA